ncbi:MAG: 4Fe-4S binding protein, partial [Deltaproteobacteria bacterium]|nr:4Fe-4S binding protein [Deltaproteobacteria bacterium]
MAKKSRLFNLASDVPYLLWLRRSSQAFFLLLFFFLFLQTESKGNDELGYPVRIFLDLDPLIFFSSILSSHRIALMLLWSLATLALTAIGGRFFCGWICPLGTMNALAGAAAGSPTISRRRSWFRIKYYLLAILLALSLGTVQLAGLFDPLSLTIRSFSLSFYPALNYLANCLLEFISEFKSIGFTQVAESLSRIFRGTFLAFYQPFFRQGLLIGAIFTSVLALNILERRFWCRYLCPLGALLGLCSQHALVKRSVSEGCTACGTCLRHCTAGAVADEKGVSIAAECHLCFACDDPCPAGAVRYSRRGAMPAIPLDIGKRRLFLAALAGVAATPFFRTMPLSRAAVFSGDLIRPPGALPEDEFLKSCIRCGECMKVCITNGLQPTFLEAGAEGLWTPILVPAIGHCEFRCTLCGQVCPTGAIRRLSLAEKASTVIGAAMIDRGRCLPWAFGISCAVCEEVCPTPEKAIRLELEEFRTRGGKTKEARAPFVDLTRCVGCGTCEAHC